MFYLCIFLFLFSAVLARFFVQWDKRTDSFIFGFLFVVFLLTAGLRYETGIDWLIYTINFDKTNPINVVLKNGFNFGEGMFLELGYGLIASTIKYFGGGIQSVFFVVSLISTVFLFKALPKVSSRFEFSLLVYFCFVYLMMEMSGMRQAVAGAIFFYSIQFIKNRQLVKYLLFIVLASSFHFTAFLLIPIYFVVNNKISSRVIFFSLLVGFLIFVFRVELIQKLMISLSSIIKNDSVVGLKLISYSTNPDLAIKRPFSLEVIIYLIFFSFFFWFRKSITKDSFFNIFFNLTWIHLLICFYLYEYYDISVRLAIYFVIGYVVLLPELLSFFKLASNRLILTVAFCFLCFLPKRAIFLELRDGLPYNPYQNYLYYKVLHKSSTGNARLDEYKKAKQ